MAFRHRPEYGEDVPAELKRARASYDKKIAEHEERLAPIRHEWSAALAAAVEAGMSYEEIVALVNVSHSSVARAIRELRS
jgi:hypothetical protein